MMEVPKNSSFFESLARFCMMPGHEQCKLQTRPHSKRWHSVASSPKRPLGKIDRNVTQFLTSSGGNIWETKSPLHGKLGSEFSFAVSSAVAGAGGIEEATATQKGKAGGGWFVMREAGGVEAPVIQSSRSTSENSQGVVATATGIEEAVAARREESSISSASES
jgi:hypothetical protein